MIYASTWTQDFLREEWTTIFRTPFETIFTWELFQSQPGNKEIMHLLFLVLFIVFLEHTFIKYVISEHSWKKSVVQWWVTFYFPICLFIYALLSFVSKFFYIIKQREKAQLKVNDTCYKYWIVKCSWNFTTFWCAHCKVKSVSMLEKSSVFHSDQSNKHHGHTLSLFCSR